VTEGLRLIAWSKTGS